MERREDSGGRGREGGGREGAREGQPDGGGPLVFSREAVRQVDRLAVERYGIPSIVLMENAARGLAEVVVSIADPAGAASPPAVVIVCGRGNNGGDGFAAARHLHNEGLAVGILLADGSDFSADAAVQVRICRQMGLRMLTAKEADPDGSLQGLADELGTPRVMVDALLGTGVDRAVTGRLAAMIVAMNRARERWSCAVVAADVPSGLDADTGRGLAENQDLLDHAVRADVTVTFVGAKRGFVALEAQPFVGDAVVRGIGAPAELVEELGQRLPPAKHPGSARKTRGRATAAAERPDRMA